MIGSVSCAPRSEPALMLSLCELQQRIFTDLWRTRLSRRRMIWLFPTPSPSPPVNKLDRRHTGILKQLLTGRGGDGGGAK